MKFEIGDKVLLRTYPISDGINKIMAKFCDLYEGPYIIKEILGKSSYTLGFLDDHKKKIAKFNIRQLKKYYE